MHLNYLAILVGFVGVTLGALIRRPVSVRLIS